MKHITGLTSEEVSSKKSLGLSNHRIDSYSPTYFQIILRNIFSLINVILIPLLGLLYYFQYNREIVSFAIFMIINTIVSAFDEIRIKRKLDKLRKEFEQKVSVIRDGQEIHIPASDVVQDDVVIVREGESVVSDGVILDAQYLQIDESALTGESDYVQKEKGDKVLSGSFVVTGQCMYQIQKVGKENYLHKLAQETLQYKERKSPIQQAGNKLIAFLVIATLIVGLTYYSSLRNANVAVSESIFSAATLVSLIIPQTLIFIFTLTFSIAITKLTRDGVLVQKGGAIEDLTHVDVICIDKTGTITTNDLKIVDVEYINTKDTEIGSLYNSVSKQLAGNNKTQQVLSSIYSSYELENVEHFDQIPFNSKNKFSLITGLINKKRTTIIFGAFSKLRDFINLDIVDSVAKKIYQGEMEGYRMIVSIVTDADVTESLEKKDLIDIFKTNKVVIYKIEDSLNPNIHKVLEDIKAQGIQVKVISGDSKTSVERILSRIGLGSSNIIDLSENKDKLEKQLQKVVEENDIFTRAIPEDKLTIVRALQANGHKVAMVGDGVNDVLSMKAADVGISMESGTKITKEIADIVLLNNDYSKVPYIFSEGRNIIFNMSISIKIFLAKSFFAILLGIIYSVQGTTLPILLSSTLIFSFLGTSLPGYFMVFARDKVEKTASFFRPVLVSSLPAAVSFLLAFLFIANVANQQSLDKFTTSAFLAIAILSISIIYVIFVLSVAKRLKNILLTIFIYIVVMLLGVYQTILPLSLPTHDNTARILLYTLVIAFIGILLFGIYRNRKSIGNKAAIITSLAVIIGLNLAVWFFPFQTWYSVSPIPVANFEYIVLISCIYISLYAIGLYMQKLFKRK